MAAFQRAGEVFGWPNAVFLVVPLFGALLVWSVYQLGARFSPRVGLASALLVSCSPAFLFQLMQPMSDVPAAALWVLAVVYATGSTRRSPLAAGLATSAAVLVRPNLVPMGFVLGGYLLMGSDPLHAATQDVESPREGGLTPMTRAMIYAAAAAPGCIAVALIQNMFYGSPWRSGYGSLDGLFALDHIVPNAMRYGAWMSQTHTPAWLIALASPFLLAGSLPMLLLMLGAVNVLCYLPYAVFNDWWYLRFMLPAIALVLVLLAVTVDAIAARLIARRPAALLAILAMALSLVLVREAEARNVFDLRRLEARYQRAGMYVGSRLPPNALVITSWESGSVRYYGKRTTLVWDALDAAWLDRALAYSRTRGLEPYLLFERWEEPLFRQRFAASPLAALDWPPSAEIASQVRVFRPDDQERYRRGEAAPTDYAR